MRFGIVARRGVLVGIPAQQAVIPSARSYQRSASIHVLFECP